MKRALAIALLGICGVASAAATVQLWINGFSANTTYFWPGGIGVFAASSSSWNSATVTLEWVGPDGATLIVAGTNTTCTANCNGVFYLPAGKIEAVVSGGTPTALYAAAYVVQGP
jgi:hypothetical protein